MFYILLTSFFALHFQLDKKSFLSWPSDFHSDMFQLMDVYKFSLPCCCYFTLLLFFFFLCRLELDSLFPSCIRTIMKWIEKYSNSRFSLWSFLLMWFMAQLKMFWLNLDIYFLLPYCSSISSNFVQEHKYIFKTKNSGEERNIIVQWPKRILWTQQWWWWWIKWRTFIA